MTGERVDVALEAMDVAIRDEFIDTMECNLYCRCGAPNDAVQKMAAEILTLRARVQAAEGDRARLDWLEAQFADHNRDCNVTLIRWQYDRELALDVEGASWSRMNVREALDAARGVG